MEVKDVSKDTDIKTAVENSVEKEVCKYQAVDITFYDPDGSEISRRPDLPSPCLSLIGQIKEDENLADPSSSMSTMRKRPKL